MKSIPHQVLLFSGHRMDAPGRSPPRFPPSMEPAAAAEIEAALDKLAAGPADLALSQAAAGGDLLFLEACTRRGLRCQVLLPLEEASFIQASVLPSANGEAWHRRWLALKPQLDEAPRLMPQWLGPTPAGVDAFERCNHWLLTTALTHGADKLRVICLWDGSDGDGPGGTRHMVDEARRLQAPLCWIDTRLL